MRRIIYAFAILAGSWLLGLSPVHAVPGVWTNVTPGNADVSGSGNGQDCGNFGTTSMVADPARPSNLYTEFNCQGIWKSTDYGQTWSGPINTGTNGAIAGDCAGGISIAPGGGTNPPILYEACIRGNALWQSPTGSGFWKSTDGGVSWTNFPIAPTPGRGDYYAPAVDSYNANHLIMAGHEMNALVQSVDGGQTWTSIAMNSGMNQNGGTASLFFINTGNASSTASTMLYLAQGTGGTIGTWRTTDGGSSWTQVDTNEHGHGSEQIYQPDTSGVVYMPGVYSALGWGVLRSSNYGQTWTHVGNSGAEAAVYGTPNRVYAAYSWACGGCTIDPSFESAAQPGLTGWTSSATPPGMAMGPATAAVVFDGSNYVIVTANWLSGLWRYVEPSNGPPPPPPPPPAGSACDINSDGSTNVSDVQLCVNQAIGVAACSTGDINKDGVCNVIDVQRDVNAALGGQCVTQ